MDRKFYVNMDCLFDREIIASQAFKDLSGGVVIKCLIKFHQKRFNRKRTKDRKGVAVRDMEIVNNGEIIFPYAEAAELGISESGFKKALQELIEDKGFIDIAEPGEWYLRQATKFSISFRWQKYGTPDYKKIEIPRRLPKKIGFQKGNPFGRKN